MKKNENTMRTIIGVAAAFMAYLVLAFVMPFQHSAVFWLSFGFTIDAFVVAGLAYWLAFRKGEDAKSKFYGFPILRIGMIYGFAQLVVGLVFMALGNIVPIWLAVLIYALGLAFAVIGLVAADTVREAITLQDEKKQKNVRTIRSLQQKAEGLTSYSMSQEETKAVHKFVEELRYSDPVSSPVLEEIETQLCQAVDMLLKAAEQGDDVRGLCQDAMRILKERNRLCLLNK